MHPIWWRRHRNSFVVQVEIKFIFSQFIFILDLVFWFLLFWTDIRQNTEINLFQFHIHFWRRKRDNTIQEEEMFSLVLNLLLKKTYHFYTWMSNSKEFFFKNMPDDNAIYIWHCTTHSVYLSLCRYSFSLLPFNIFISCDKLTFI